MKVLFSTLFSCVLFVSLASAADIVVKEEPVPKNSFARVSVALETGQTVLWDVSPEPITVEEFTVERKGNLHFSGVPGTKYKVTMTLLTIDDGKIVADRKRKYVTIEGVPEDEEPEPVPVPDIGATVLQTSVQLAWREDAAEERPLVKSLAQFYAKYAKPQEIAKYQTWGALEAAMRADATAFGIAGKLPKTQTAIHEYLIKYLPGRTEGWEKLAISATGKNSAKVAFTNVSNALNKVK